MKSAERCDSENNIARTQHSLVVNFIQMTVIRERFAARKVSLPRQQRPCIAEMTTRLTVFKRDTYS